MDSDKPIDIAFDFRSDTPPGRDPDTLSPTLRRHHKVLWSKLLPSGAVFELADTTPRIYLHHHSQLGDFSMASDSVIPTFRKEPRLSKVFEQIPDQLAEFMTVGYTIGGMMLFPGNRIGVPGSAALLEDSTARGHRSRVIGAAAAVMAAVQL